MLPPVNGSRTVTSSWLKLALRPDIVRRSLLVSAIVGPILVLINQGDVILSGSMSGRTIAKTVLTVLVPYAVATYGAVSSLRRAQRSGEDR